MKKLGLLAAFLLLTSLAAATTVSHEDVVVDLGTGEVDVTVNVTELTSSHFTYLTSYPVSNVQATFDGKPVECTVSDLQFGSEIRCPVDKKRFVANLNFEASDLVNRERNIHVFRYTHSVFRPTEELDFRVVLPSGMGLVDRQNVSSPVTSPPGADIGSNGRRIFVEWNLNPELGRNINFQVLYEPLGDQNDYIDILKPLIALIIIILVAVLVYRRKKSAGFEQVYDELEDDETEVFDIVLENDGEILQKDVVAQSEYSKAKISGVVNSLVEKGVLTKEKKGRSNMLKISKKYRS